MATLNCMFSGENLIEIIANAWRRVTRRYKMIQHNPLLTVKVMTVKPPATVLKLVSHEGRTVRPCSRTVRYFYGLMHLEIQNHTGTVKVNLLLTYLMNFFAGCITMFSFELKNNDRWRGSNLKV